MTPDPEASPFDLTWLEEQVGSDRAILSRLLNAYLANQAALVADLEQEGVDPERVLLLAHRFKTAAATVGAHRLAAASAELEKHPSAPGLLPVVLELAAATALALQDFMTRECPGG